MRELGRKIRISFNYYRSFAPFNVAITLLCAYGMCLAGSTDSLSALTFVKIGGIAFSFFLIKILRAHELYYYRNLEIPRAMVWAVAGITDLVLFAAMMALTARFVL